jgi:serine/threonine-protein kinase
MISYDGVVKLVDFGIAKAVSQVEQTRPGVVKGKYAYMSPEQTTNQPLDGRSDVFSLALVLWELIAGRVALDRTDPVETMRAIRDGKIPPIESVRPGVPAALAAALGHALRGKRDERATAAELGTMLEGFIKSTPEMATSLQLAEWVTGRFPRASAATGEHPPLAGTPPGTRPATVAATAATAAATSADQHEATEISSPPTALIPSGARPPVVGIPDVTGQHHHSSSRRRIAIVAVLVAAAGMIGMLLFFSGSTCGGTERSVAATAPGPEAPPAAGAAPDATAVAAPVAPAIDAAAAEAAPMTAELEVVTDPPDAAISLGPGRPTGISPAKFTELQPGTIHVRVELDGYEVVERDVALGSGERRTLELPLRRIPPPIVAPPVGRPPPVRAANGTLTVRTNPYSEVWLGGRRLGVTPFAGIKLAPGSYTLTFKHPGKKAYKRGVVIKSGQTTKVNFKLP